MGLPISWDFQYHGTTNIMGLPISWDCQYHGTANIMELPMSWDCQYHGTLNIMGLPISWDWKWGTKIACGSHSRELTIQEVMELHCVSLPDVVE
ncbi:hypothetical protein AVEN_67830-1 [Araneus ventricosus]|uniref:Uncharacterized protein n=1 Tax=Araneus ventricosus TaxID=182803 RepID=A0A4Y2MC42_ARAVE|nr:hypothetical protein AVEN_67830-1 [Araneus ventricosus]